MRESALPRPTTMLTRRGALTGLVALAALAGPARAVLAIPNEPITPVRVTGGGWFTDVATGARITLGFEVHIPGNPVIPGNPIRGTFELQNHATGLTLHSNQITDLFAQDGTAASFSGIASDETPFHVDLTQPASVSLTVNDGALTGVLQGGAITVRGSTPAT